jgi:hypothetical protein
MENLLLGLFLKLGFLGVFFIKTTTLVSNGPWVDEVCDIFLGFSRPTYTRLYKTLGVFGDGP